MKCSVCGSEFRGRSGAKYCSGKCRKKGWREDLSVTSSELSVTNAEISVTKKDILVTDKISVTDDPFKIKLAEWAGFSEEVRERALGRVNAGKVNLGNLSGEDKRAVFTLLWLGHDTRSPVCRR